MHEITLASVLIHVDNWKAKLLENRSKMSNENIYLMAFEKRLIRSHKKQFLYQFHALSDRVYARTTLWWVQNSFLIAFTLHKSSNLNGKQNHKT